MKAGKTIITAQAERMAKFRAAGASLTDEEIVELMKKSIKGGAMKEITMAQVKDWRATGKETFDGKTYQTGLATYEASNIFGRRTWEAKALFKQGEIERWVYAKTGLKIE